MIKDLRNQVVNINGFSIKYRDEKAKNPFQCLFR